MPRCHNNDESIYFFLLYFPGQRYSVLVTMDQDLGSYWATTSVRYRSGGPDGHIILKYNGSTQSNLTLNGPFPDHPRHDDIEPTLELEDKLVTKNVESYPDYNILSAENEDSIKRFVIVGTQATDLTSGKLRWALNNITYETPSKPFILSAYEAANADGAAPWPDTLIPEAVILPEIPPNTWNYTESVHDTVGTYNGKSGPSIMPVKGKLWYLAASCNSNKSLKPTKNSSTFSRGRNR